MWGVRLSAPIDQEDVWGVTAPPKASLRLPRVLPMIKARGISDGKTQKPVASSASAHTGMLRTWWEDLISNGVWVEERFGHPF